ncbi:hypothetical protein, partial [Nocardioides sp.]|uniref:hypothetical protein n=1 Tax=Nocardioides sp. TaxID=35761 RepID=UPI002735DA2C
MAGGAGVFVVFTVLVLVGSLPFWAIGWATGLTLPANLPITALQVVVPLLAALTVAGWAGGRSSMSRLVRRLLLGGSPNVWWVAAVSLPAALAVTAYASMWWSG